MHFECQIHSKHQNWIFKGLFKTNSEFGIVSKFLEKSQVIQRACSAFTLQSRCSDYLLSSGTMTERKTLEVLLGNHSLLIEKSPQSLKKQQVVTILRKSSNIYYCTMYLYIVGIVLIQGPYTNDVISRGGGRRKVR